MKTKQILFTAPGIAELCEVELKDLAPEEVLVETAVSSVSAGTERAIASGDPNISIYSSGEVRFPRSSGYSSSGTVLRVGSAVTTVAPGDRVAVSWGCHAQHQVIRTERNVCRLPDGVGFAEAALCHIATFPMGAIRKCHLEIGESALVMGLGVLGMLAIPLLRTAGAVPIVAADPVPEKRAEALLRGADYALDPYDPDFAKTVKELTGGGVNVAIEVTGVGAALNGVLDCMAKMGRVALLGCTRNSDFTVDYYRKVHGPGITLVGAHTLARPELESAPGLWTTRDDVAALLRLMSLGRIAPSEMIAETHSPKDCSAVYARLCREKSFPLVQFDWKNQK